MDLRTTIPTLEPDEAFLERLSALAAAGAPTPGPARPVSTWRVGLAAAAVALVLMGVAWLAGLRPAGTDTAPTPGPVDSPTPSPSYDPDSTSLQPGAGQLPGRGLHGLGPVLFDVPPVDAPPDHAPPVDMPPDDAPPVDAPPVDPPPGQLTAAEPPAAEHLPSHPPRPEPSATSSPGVRAHGPGHGQGDGEAHAYGLPTTDAINSDTDATDTDIEDELQEHGSKHAR